MNTTHNALELYEIHVKESLSLFVCLVFLVVFVSFLFCSLFYYYFIFLRITKKRSIILRREVNHDIYKEYRSAVIVVGHVKLIRIPQ